MLEKVSIFNFTTDCWTSIQNFSYLSLTAHFFTENLRLTSICLAVRHILGGHCSSNLVDYIKEILNEYKIGSKVGFFTTDNVNAMEKTVNDLGFERVPCFAHVLNLIIKNTLGSIKLHSKPNQELNDPETEYDQIDKVETNEEENDYDQQLNSVTKVSNKERLRLNLKTTLNSYSGRFKIFDRG